MIQDHINKVDLTNKAFLKPLEIVVKFTPLTRLLFQLVLKPDG